jgi:hypothetical protein
LTRSGWVRIVDERRVGQLAGWHERRLTPLDAAGIVIDAERDPAWRPERFAPGKMLEQIFFPLLKTSGLLPHL